MTTGFFAALSTGCIFGGHTTSAPMVSSAGGVASTIATIPATTVLPIFIPPASLTTVASTVAPSTTVAPMAVAVPIGTRPDRGLSGGTVLMVGDSISIDVQPYLAPHGVTVNGEVSRQFSTGIEVVEAIASAHQLPGTLVVELGTNGTVTADEVGEMIRAARGVDHIVFLTVDVPRSWEAGDNAVLGAAPTRYPRLVAVADWHALASRHPEWFASDHVHLEPGGARAMTALILEAVH